jgi:hypothetical protein
MGFPLGVFISNNALIMIKTAFPASPLSFFQMNGKAEVDDQSEPIFYCGLTLHSIGIKNAR